MLGEQTRPHKDLDVIMLLEDVPCLFKLMEGDGYSLKEIWSENLWVTESQGKEIATAFDLRDTDGRELDAHAMVLDERAWEAEGFIFQKDDLAGEGVIAGNVVQCLSPESQMLCHTGYELHEAQLRDLDLLHEKFGTVYPDGQK